MTVTNAMANLPNDAATAPAGHEKPCGGFAPCRADELEEKSYRQERGQDEKIQRSYNHV